MKPLTRRFGLLFALLGLAAAGVVFFGTSVAPWAYSDGVGYLVSARNLVEGPGLGLVKPSGQFEPLITHPPLYPLLLAGGRVLGLEVIQAARLIDVVAFAGLVGFSGWFTHRLSGRFRAGLAVSLLLLVSPPLVLLYLSAMAEPIFLLTGIVSLLLLTHGLQSESRWTLIASAALAGLSGLSRYPGIVFVVTGVLMLGLQRGGGWNRVKSASTYGAIGAAPLAVFFALSHFVRTAGAARWLAPLELQPAELVAFLRQLFRVVWTWKPLPTAAVLDSLRPGVAAWSAGINGVLVVAISASFLAYLWLNRRRASASLAAGAWPYLLPAVCGAFVALYLAFLLLAFLFSSPTPDVDFRTVLPVLPAVLIGGVAWLDSLDPQDVGESSNSSFLYWLLIIAVVAGYLPTTAELVIGHHRTGAGYTSASWENSPLIHAASQAPIRSPLISNAPEAVLLQLDRYPHDYMNTRPSSGSAVCPEVMRRLLIEENGRLIIFSTVGDPAAAPLDLESEVERLQSSCSLEIINRFPDGVILAAPYGGG